MWISLFRFYTGVQRNNEAADAMLSRLAKRIDIPEAQKVFVLAQLYESIGSRTEAARFYLESLRLSPAELPPRRLLIRSALRLKDNAAALAEIDALLGFNPPDAPELIRRRAALLRP